jgi:hypothetical protein
MSADGPVLLRDSRDPDGPTLAFAAERWSAFVRAAGAPGAGRARGGRIARLAEDLAGALARMRQMRAEWAADAPAVAHETCGARRHCRPPGGGGG